DRRIPSLFSPEELAKKRSANPKHLLRLKPRPGYIRASKPLEVCQNLRPERPSIRELVDRIRAECRRIDLPPPNWRTVKLRIRRVDARKAMMRREGAAAARAVFTPVVEEYRSAGPLDVVQIDHIQSNICPEPYGRLALAILGMPISGRLRRFPLRTPKSSNSASM